MAYSNAIIIHWWLFDNTNTMTRICTQTQKNIKLMFSLMWLVKNMMYVANICFGDRVFSMYNMCMLTIKGIYVFKLVI